MRELMWIVIQILHHLHGDKRGIFWAPSLRRIAQDAEFEGQTIAMRIDISVHTTCVVLKICAILGRGDLGLLHCRRPQAKYPLLAVDLERVFANDLRQLS